MEKVLLAGQEEATAETKAPSYSYYTEPFPLENRPARFLEIFSQILQYSNYLPIIDLYSRLVMKCSKCSSSCQIYQATGSPEDIPCYRSELLLKVYRRYFTFMGALKGRLAREPLLTDKYIDKMAEEYYHCTACRRCTLYCPMGIDHGLITHLARYILSEMGIVPKALQVAVREQLLGKTKNTSAIPAMALEDTCSFLEEELEDQYQVKVKYPLNQKNAEYIFFPAVSDYLLEPDTLMGNAAVLQRANVRWTIGTNYFDGINYGLFYNDKLLGRIIKEEIKEAKRLGAKKILIGECGHAYRSARSFVPIFSEENNPIEVVHCIELALHLIEKGKLKLKEGVIDEVVTYHDPCNIARNGWIIDQPREILKIIAKNYVEMTPSGRYNYCCGGGGGLVSIDEIRKYRTTVIGKKKADQIRDTGAKYVVTPCANCKKQLSEVCQDNELANAEIVGLHNLILKAIEW